MTGVAVVTDSAADLSPDAAAAAGISVVPLMVSFGEEQFRDGVDLSLDAFYSRLLAAGSPFPRTAACSPGDFQAVFEARLAQGAPAVVCLTVGGQLSATLAAARLAAEARPSQPVHVVDSESASMAQGLLAMLAAEAATAGEPAEDIVALLEARRSEARVFVMLETLEYLRRGGRINAAQAAIGSLLSVKPIITIRDGVVETADRPRTHGRARARLLELLTGQPLERAAVLRTEAADVDGFAGELAARAGLEREVVTIGRIGPTIGSHVGPGALGAAILLRGA